jgi:hypothetical protein
MQNPYVGSLQTGETSKERNDSKNFWGRKEEEKKTLHSWPAVMSHVIYGLVDYMRHFGWPKM